MQHRRRHWPPRCCEPRHRRRTEKTERQRRRSARRDSSDDGPNDGSDDDPVIRVFAAGVVAAGVVAGVVVGAAVVGAAVAGVVAGVVVGVAGVVDAFFAASPSLVRCRCRRRRQHHRCCRRYDGVDCLASIVSVGAINIYTAWGPSAAAFDAFGFWIHTSATRRLLSAACFGTTVWPNSKPQANSRSNQH